MLMFNQPVLISHITTYWTFNNLFLDKDHTSWPLGSSAISASFSSYLNIHYLLLGHHTVSQSSRAPLGCGGAGGLLHRCAADKSATTVWCYHVNMDQYLCGVFPTLVESICHEELQSGSQSHIDICVTRHTGVRLHVHSNKLIWFTAIHSQSTNKRPVKGCPKQWHLQVRNHLSRFTNWFTNVRNTRLSNPGNPLPCYTRYTKQKCPVSVQWSTIYSSYINNIKNSTIWFSFIFKCLL